MTVPTQPDPSLDDKKHVVLLLTVIVLTVVGLAVTIPDVLKNGQLHLVNGFVGGVALLFAIGFALPTRFKVAIDTIAPYLDNWGGPKK